MNKSETDFEWTVSWISLALAAIFSLALLMVMIFAVWATGHDQTHLFQTALIITAPTILSLLVSLFTSEWYEEW